MNWIALAKERCGTVGVPPTVLEHARKAKCFEPTFFEPPVGSKLYQVLSLADKIRVCAGDVPGSDQDARLRLAALWTEWMNSKDLGTSAEDAFLEKQFWEMIRLVNTVERSVSQS